MEIDFATLDLALKTSGDVLADRGLHYEVVAIGGGGLLLLGQMIRPTRDLDLVALIDEGEFVTATPLPEQLLKAIEEVSISLALGKDWLNSGPTSLLELGLPNGFEARMHTRSYHGLTVYLAGRFDQICFKLYAAVYQGPKSKHFADLTQLKPTMEELEAAQKWCLTHDSSEGFVQELQVALNSFRRERGNP